MSALIVGNEYYIKQYTTTLSTLDSLVAPNNVSQTVFYNGIYQENNYPTLPLKPQER
jgi:hypothetical protein